jgi:hypothetical protein
MRAFFAVFALMLAASAGSAEPAAGLAEFNWLVGDWAGLGEGEPGKSATERHIAPMLDGKFLRVEGRSVYPRQEGNPKGDVHAELGVWSFDRARKSIVLREFDTLGFVGTYVLDRKASEANRWVLVAEHLENVPSGWRARYIYTFVAPNEYHEVLELDSDGKGFKPYVGNRFLKVERAGH